MLQQGALEIRWTWLPYWLAAGPKLHGELQSLMRDTVLLNGLPPTEESLDLIEEFLLREIGKRFKIPGLVDFLRALHNIPE